MNRQQIEAWALRTVRAVIETRAVEDANVELKRDWPSDHARAARQLAALANASRTDVVMWLVGVDEKDGIVLVSDSELSNWWGAVCRWFDPPAPQMHNVTTYANGKPVVALVFDASARPFLVNDGAGRWIVPWREANGTRTANRAELLQILSPHVQLPNFEILSLEAWADEPQPGEDQTWSTLLEAYVHQDPDAVVVFPNHRCTGTIEVPEFRLRIDLPKATFYTPDRRQLIPDPVLRGPERVRLRMEGNLPFNPGWAIPLAASEPVTVRLNLQPANSDAAVVVDEVLQTVESDLWGEWSLQ